jgi:hypothetical protein
VSDLSIEHLMAASYWIAAASCPALLAYMVAKSKLTKDRFKRFLGIFTIALACSMIPLGPLGLAFGGPSALLASILVTAFLDAGSTAHEFSDVRPVHYQLRHGGRPFWFTLDCNAGISSGGSSWLDFQSTDDPKKVTCPDCIARRLPL